MIEVYLNVHNGRFVTTRSVSVESLDDLVINESNTEVFAFTKDGTFKLINNKWVKEK